MITASQIAEQLDARPDRRGGWLACCPAHEDRSPSLSIGEGRDGRVLLNCFAGCTFPSICGAMNIPESELFPASDGPPAYRKPLSPREAAKRAAINHLRSRLTAQERILPTVAIFTDQENLDRAIAHALALTMNQEFVVLVGVDDLAFANDLEPYSLKLAAEMEQKTNATAS